MVTSNDDELKIAFQRDGYVFIPGFLTGDEVNHVNDRLKKYIREAVPGMSPDHVFYEDKENAGTLKQLQDMNVYDPFFNEMLFDSRFEKVAELLLEEKAIGKTIEYFNKPPRIGKPTPPHQDGYYFMLTPSKAVTMWIALEDADMENGCVRYIKGSHLTGMRPHGRTATLGFSQGITDYGEDDIANEIAFPAKPGDLLIHHSLTVHTAGGNKTDSRSRKALGFIYFAESAKPDAEKLKAYRETLKTTVI